MLIVRVGDQHALLDFIEVFGKTVGIAFDALNHVLDDHLEQPSGRFDDAAGAQRSGASPRARLGRSGR